jgi:hypothetical protein
LDTQATIERRIVIATVAALINELTPEERAFIAEHLRPNQKEAH